jgi:hypothetical protein
MISKRNKDNSTACSHPVTKHEFEDNKYVGDFSFFIVTKTHVVRSSKGSGRLNIKVHWLHSEGPGGRLPLNLRAARTP